MQPDSQQLGMLPTLSSNVEGVAGPITGSTGATPSHHLDIPPEEETANQGTDAHPDPTIKDAVISIKM